MNQKLLQKLKRISPKDFFHIFLFIAAVPVSCFYKIFYPNLWIFCDCADEARDNAYWLFKYISHMDPNQEMVFALNPMSTDYPKVLQYGKVVPFGSFRHWIYYLCAKNVISSQKAAGPNAAICYILDRFRFTRGNHIFLQHGIIKDDISYLHYKYTNIRLFACSTQRELEYVRKVYGYPPDYIQLLGLCRFDQLIASKEVPGELLIMPTWRKWLSHPTEGIAKHNLEQNFLLSDYYLKWMNLLNCPTFIHLIEHFNIHVIFYLHREAQKFSKFFSSSCPQIEIGTFPKHDVQTLLKNAQLLITDYSSVAMDFAFMGKPLFYYQFDYSEYRKRHLAEGYFDYTADGFGPVCISEQQLLGALSNYLNTDLTEDTVYKERRDLFFSLKDNQNCERTFRAIQRLG